MPARWPAAAFLQSEKSYRKIMGYRDLWARKAILDGLPPATRQAVAQNGHHPLRSTSHCARDTVPPRVLPNRGQWAQFGYRRKMDP
jgi:hypothetical protein